MTITHHIKRLLTVVIVGSVSSIAIAGNPQTLSAPKASAEDALIKHWNMPDISRNFWDISELDSPFIDTAPEDRKDGIEVGQLGPDGGNKTMIINLAKEIADKKHGEVDSLLIAHKGKVLFESYYSRGRIDLSHPQSSTTKAYTGLAIGRAIQLGYLSLADLDKPVVSLLKGLDASKFVEGVESITLHQVMTMTSGLQISPDQFEYYRNNPQQYQGIQQIQAFFEDSAPISAAAKTFNYQGPNPDIAMFVLDTVVPGSADDFIRNELFNKMGIVNYDWRADSNSGLPASGVFSSVTSRDMVKLGTLVRNNGKWKGEQLIPVSFIKKSTQRNVHLSAEQVKNFYSGENLSNSGYGYFWWQADMNVGGQRYSSSSAQGGGGMTILTIDELDLLVVVTAHSRQAYLQMIAEKVVPAFI